MSASPFLWLYGASGVGKSTLGWELFRLLNTAGINGAYVDADQLGLCYPVAPDDHSNHHLKAANLAAAWNCYRTAGSFSGGGGVAALSLSAVATLPLLTVTAHTSLAAIVAITTARGMGIGFAIMPVMAAAYSAIGPARSRTPLHS